MSKGIRGMFIICLLSVSVVGSRLPSGSKGQSFWTETVEISGVSLTLEYATVKSSDQKKAGLNIMLTAVDNFNTGDQTSKSANPAINAQLVTQLILHQLPDIAAALKSEHIKQLIEGVQGSNRLGTAFINLSSEQLKKLDGLMKLSSSEFNEESVIKSAHEKFPLTINGVAWGTLTVTAGLDSQSQEPLKLLDFQLKPVKDQTLSPDSLQETVLEISPELIVPTAYYTEMAQKVNENTAFSGKIILGADQVLAEGDVETQSYQADRRNIISNHFEFDGELEVEIEAEHVLESSHQLLGLKIKFYFACLKDGCQKHRHGIIENFLAPLTSKVTGLAQQIQTCLSSVSQLEEDSYVECRFDIHSATITETRELSQKIQITKQLSKDVVELIQPTTQETKIIEIPTPSELSVALKSGRKVEASVEFPASGSGKIAGRLFILKVHGDPTDQASGNPAAELILAIQPMKLANFPSKLLNPFGFSLSERRTLTFTLFSTGEDYSDHLVRIEDTETGEMLVGNVAWVPKAELPLIEQSQTGVLKGDGKGGYYVRVTLHTNSQGVLVHSMGAQFNLVAYQSLRKTLTNRKSQKMTKSATEFQEKLVKFNQKNYSEDHFQVRDQEIRLSGSMQPPSFTHKFEKKTVEYHMENGMIFIQGQNPMDFNTFRIWRERHQAQWSENERVEWATVVQEMFQEPTPHTVDGKAMTEAEFQEWVKVNKKVLHFESTATGQVTFYYDGNSYSQEQWKNVCVKFGFSESGVPVAKTSSTQGSGIPMQAIVRQGKIIIQGVERSGKQFEEWRQTNWKKFNEDEQKYWGEYTAAKIDASAPLIVVDGLKMTEREKNVYLLVHRDDPVVVETFTVDEFARRQVTYHFRTLTFTTLTDWEKYVESHSGEVVCVQQGKKWTRVALKIEIRKGFFYINGVEHSWVGFLAYRAKNFEIIRKAYPDLALLDARTYWTKYATEFVDFSVVIDGLVYSCRFMVAGGLVSFLGQPMKPDALRAIMKKRAEVEREYFDVVSNNWAKARVHTLKVNDNGDVEGDGKVLKTYLEFTVWLATIRLEISQELYTQYSKISNYDFIRMQQIFRVDGQLMTRQQADEYFLKKKMLTAQSRVWVYQNQAYNNRYDFDKYILTTEMKIFFEFVNGFLEVRALHFYWVGTTLYFYEHKVSYELFISFVQFFETNFKNSYDYIVFLRGFRIQYETYRVQYQTTYVTETVEKYDGSFWVNGLRQSPAQWEARMARLTVGMTLEAARAYRERQNLMVDNAKSISWQGGLYTPNEMIIEMRRWPLYEFKIDGVSNKCTISPRQIYGQIPGRYVYGTITTISPCIRPFPRTPEEVNAARNKIRYSII